MSDRSFGEISEAAETEGVTLSEFVRRAVRKAVTRGSTHQFQEIALSGAGQEVEQMMEWLCARQPLVRDLVDGAGHLDTSLVTLLRRELSPVQSRRVIRVLEGEGYEEIGFDEGCSRQAVHASVNRAFQALHGHRGLAEALCETIPEAELDPDLLMGGFSGR